MRRVVITGCSGGGKSAVVNELARRGHAVVHEPGRRVIAAERNTGGAGFPWEDTLRFSTLAYWMSVGDHGAATNDPTFLDRSALDQAAWFLRQGLPVPGALPDYHRTVFIVQPWLDVFHNDPDRRHSFDDAVSEYTDLVERLPGWGYTCRALPQASVSARADWLLSALGSGDAAA